MLLGWLIASGGVALAHGGFPWSTDVVFAPDDPDGERPVVVTSFGLLATEDDGAWSWVCEEVVGTIGMTAFVALEDGVWLKGDLHIHSRHSDQMTEASPGRSRTASGPTSRCAPSFRAPRACRWRW